VGFPEAKQYLESLGIDAMKSMSPSLHRIEALCEILANPERSVPAIHVAGTNGKTSTARIAAAVLTASGLSVGTYTSPHLQTIRERIALEGEPISADEFGAVFDHIHPYLETVESKLNESLSFFEILTAMFFLWAAEAPVDAMVVEVGLGGRWDASNIVPAPVAVITNVGLDHTGLLGNDRETIALEKAGVVKPSGTVVTAERTPSVVSVIEQEATRAGATTVRIDRDFSLADNRIAFGGRYLSISTRSRAYEGLYLPLHGSHQGRNAAAALEAVLSLLPAAGLADTVVAEGFGNVIVPGRLETLHAENEAGPPIVMDVAHNSDGMAALVSSLVETFAFERVLFVVGILGDKDYRGMLQEITRVPGTLVATRPATVRGVALEDLGKTAADLGIDCETIADVGAAVERALSLAGPAELVCITGSHYVVGEARTHLLGEPDVEKQV
jgi:dihydrofolate synthase/folylpolyglutamate synthase